MTKKSKKEIEVPGVRSLWQPAGESGIANRTSGLCVGPAASCRRQGDSYGRAAWMNTVILFPLCFFMLVLAGCSGSKPHLDGFSVTDPSSGAAITTVIVNATADVSVSVGSDGPNLGVDWSLVCGGSPNTALEPASVACGSLNPVHVGNSIAMVYTAPAYVPIGSTVTLTAAVTSDPSVTASVTLTILPRPITIAWTQGELPPATDCPSGSLYCMAASATGVQNTVQLAATVSNDPTAVGVIWSCSSSVGACGSFDPALTASGGTTTVYSAPATALASLPSKIIITATPACETEAVNPCTSTASISETITVPAVAVAASALPSTVEAGGGSATLTANVSWDASNSGVTWTARCGDGSASCGSIAQASCVAGVAPVFASVCTATYTAPQSIPTGTTKFPVTVTATSNADSSQTGSAAITVGPPPPIAVSVAGPQGSSQMESQVNGTTILTATVTNDFSKSGASAGVNWDCSPGSCSPASSTSYPFTTTYTAPGAVPSTNPVVTATSIFCNQNPNATQCANDPASTGSASITILPAISVTITKPASVTAGVGASFSATVSNDVNDAGVDWSANCAVSSNCGTFTPAHTASGATTSFLAPNNLPWSANPNVTITAISTASVTVPPLFPQVYARPGAGIQDPISVTVTPVVYVHFVPFAPSQLAMGGNSVNLIAVAANDSTHAGVDWSVCSDASTCGQFLVNPAVPATLDSPAVSAVYSSKIHAASGQTVSYQPPIQTPANGTITMTVNSTAVSTASASQVISITNNSSFTGPALTGKVLAGTLPVSGSKVQLYQAGNSGYGSASAPLAITAAGGYSVTTAGDGSFTIPAGYICSAQNAMLYLVATGGTVSGKSSANAQSGLLTGLGACSNLNSAVPLIVNEVTTVATAWTLAPFTGSGGGSFQNYQYIGSSSGNYGSGLANAFATINNLVDITTGLALQTTPAGGGFTPPGGSSEVYDGAVPVAEINTLADAIDTCAATTGGLPGDGSACDLFFQASDVNPVGGIGTSSNAPSSILQAVLEVAKYPSKTGINVGNASNPVTGTPLYALVFNQIASGGTLPFPTVLSAPPTDWSIALSYSGGGLEGVMTAKAGPSAMAIDAVGNLWIANRSISSVTKLSNLGAFLSPYASGSTLATAGGFKGAGVNRPLQIAIDPYGSAWTLNNDSSLSEGTTSCLSATSLNPFCGSGSFPYAGVSGNVGAGLAIDGTGNVWVADKDNSGAGGDVAEYAGFYSCQNGSVCAAGGMQVSEGELIGDFTNLNAVGDSIDTQPANPQSLAIDGKDNVWVLDQANYAAAVLSGKNGSLELVDHGDQYALNSGQSPDPVLTSSPYQWGHTLAFDSAGNTFIPDDDPADYNYIFELYSCESGANSADCGLAQAPISLSSSTVAGVNAPIVMDGSNSLWFVAKPNSSLGVPTSVVELSASGSLMNANVPLNPGFGYVASTYATLSNSSSSTVTYDAATPWTPTATSIAGDPSGNLWVLSGGTAPVVWEFIGVETPVVTPLSLGKPGTKP